MAAARAMPDGTRLGLDDLPKLRSLLVVVPDASRFVAIGNIIQSFYSNFVAHSMPNAWMGPTERQRFITELEQIKSDCEAMGLDDTTAILDWMIADYKSNAHTQVQLKSAVEYLNGAFQGELHAHLFLQVDADRVNWLRTEEQFVEDPIFGIAALNNFGSAKTDMRQAGCCFAMYRRTACVFHCMRVVERGLIALAGTLNVPFAIPFEYKQWHNISSRSKRRFGT